MANGQNVNDHKKIQLTLWMMKQIGYCGGIKCAGSLTSTRAIGWGVRNFSVPINSFPIHPLYCIQIEAKKSTNNFRSIIEIPGDQSASDFHPKK